MKKLLFIAIAFAFAFQSFAQNADHKSTISVNAGFSLVGKLLDVANTVSSTVTDGPKSTSIPALQVTYDYGIVNWLSIGGAFSYQMMKSDVPSMDLSGNLYTYTDKINRMNVAARVLFHYANSGRVDLYSGFRMGMTNWSFSTDNTDNTYNVSDYWGLKNNFAPQVILFGLRAYITDNLGVNSEFCVGAPHYFSAGLSYRL